MYATSSPAKRCEEDRQLYPLGVEEGGRSMKQSREGEKKYTPYLEREEDPSPVLASLPLVAFWASRGTLHGLTLLSPSFCFG